MKRNGKLMKTVSGRLSLCPFLTVLIKFLLFDLIWCGYTTFTPFSCWQTYVTAITMSMALTIPYVLIRKAAAAIPVWVLLDIWFICNLLYFRTYLSAIPLSSYFLAGNLSDFMPSVWASFRWVDLLFPLTTIIGVTAMLTKKLRQKMTIPFSKRVFFSVFLLLCVLLGAAVYSRGGFRQEYGQLQFSAHDYASGPALYTLFGTVYYDYLNGYQPLTESQKQEINDWIAHTPELSPIDSLATRDNCIVIIVESFESWVLNLSVENQEITPNLNRLLKEPNTLYAPHVYTQVNGGRSIDAQLLFLAGMLPLKTGCYSSNFPTNTYHALPKALKEFKNTRNYLLTVDKTKTWNQGTVAHGFGIDTIISYPDFRMTETFGNRTRLGDRAFFTQCIEKMKNGEIWRPGENAFIQMVTYSGHSPFKMPEELKSVHFSDRIPEMMADYMSVAHYTDEGIGKFIEYLKSRPEYAHTMIVITGDHEGLADNRKDLCATAAGRGIVSDKEFTPFIVLNSPVPMHYTGVMGQVDIYPTMLNLLGLENYSWKGIGRSILDPGKPQVAISPRTYHIEGDTTSVSEYEMRRLRLSPAISDLLIRFNLLQ